MDHVVKLIEEPNDDDWPDPPEFFHNISIPLSVTSELELKIRKEVLDTLNDVLEKHKELALNKTGLLHIKDRLNLLWGKDNE